MNQPTDGAPRRSSRVSVPFVAPTLPTRPSGAAPRRGSRAFYSPGMGISSPVAGPVVAATPVASRPAAEPVSAAWEPQPRAEPIPAGRALSSPESPNAESEELELPEIGGAEPRSLDELLAALEAEIAADPERGEQSTERVVVEAAPASQFEAAAVEAQVDELMAELQPERETGRESVRAPEHVVAPPATGSQMIVDFCDVVGGAPEASFDREGLHAQTLGPGVFSTLETWDGSRGEDAPPAEEASAPPVAPLPLDAPVGFPTPSIFLQTIAGTLTPQRMGEGMGTRGGDPRSWDPVPETPALRQIVEAHVAAGGDGASIASALERVAERVRRGEIRVPAGAAKGEAAALAVALAALLQPGRQ
jgi:hypothetical protein